MRDKPALSASEGRPGSFSYQLHGPTELTRRRVRNSAILVAAVLGVLAATAYPVPLFAIPLAVGGVAAAGGAVWVHRRWTR